MPPPPGEGPTTIVRINPETFAEGGLDVSKQPKAGVQGFSSSVAKQFLPIDFQYPGLHVLNMDPPVFSVESFLPAEVCDELVQRAGASGQLARSQAVKDPNNPDAESMRTSSSLAINSEVMASHPKLKENYDEILRRVQKLIALDSWDGEVTKKFTKPSAPGQFVFELPQIARYKPKEHFLAHEDAFPIEHARDKGYQRRATVLVYLNDVPEGGHTKFDIIGISAQPKKGNALVFFPSFQNGLPDHRTLHTAEDALDGCEKWVSQTWVSWGLDDNDRSTGASKAVARRMDGGGSKDKGKKKKGTKGFGDAKGFGGPKPAAKAKGFGR